MYRVFVVLIALLGRYPNRPTGGVNESKEGNFIPLLHYQESLKVDFHMLLSSVFCGLDLYIRTGVGLSAAKPVSR